MFAVAFEVQPHPDMLDAYLETAKTLRPILEMIDGFLDIDRYKSGSRPGWLLSLSFWADEAALVRWRAQERHHIAQVEGRATIFADYRIRVAQIVLDDDRIHAPRTPARRSAYRDPARGSSPFLSFSESTVAAASLAGGETFESIYHPGKTMVLGEHATESEAARRHDMLRAADTSSIARFRIGEVERDYRLHVRDEAPQFMK